MDAENTHRQRTAMPKIFLVPYRGPVDDGAVEAALQWSVSFGAEVQGWNFLPDPVDIMASLEGYTGMSVGAGSFIDMQRLEEENKSATKEAGRFFTNTVNKFVGTRATFHSAIGKPEKLVAARGGLSDLIVVTRSSEKIDNAPVINGALFGSGRPVLLVPPEMPAAASGQHALIAWNGSRESARALAFALPYLSGVKVSVMAWEPRAGDFCSNGDELAVYLASHGIVADVVTRHVDEVISPGSVLDVGKKIGADFVVMGAWGHGRVKEYILGGVTDYMLDSADLPIFTAH